MEFLNVRLAISSTRGFWVRCKLGDVPGLSWLRLGDWIQGCSSLESPSVDQNYLVSMVKLHTLMIHRVLKASNLK